jgi:hypothetical protein
MKSWRRCASDERCATRGLPLFERFSDKQDTFAPQRYIGEMDMRMTVFAALAGSPWGRRDGERLGRAIECDGHRRRRSSKFRRHHSGRVQGAHMV